MAEATRTDFDSETLLLTIVAMVVLRFEFLRRGEGLGDGQSGRYSEVLKRVMKQYAPEVAGLVATLALAALLRARGDAGSEDSPTWAEIKAQWPLLMTADTLLSLQAMLRLLVLLSVVFRSTGTPTPLAEEAAAMWFVAAVARVALLWRTSVYMMEGPLGGWITAAFEVAVLPVLGLMSRSAFGRAPLSLCLTVAGMSAFAWRNRLNLSEDATADALFVFAYCGDMLSALGYLLRTALVEKVPGRTDVSVGFTHLLMPVQASLSAYYFLQAFEPTRELVGQGRPFEVLQISNTVAFGAYVGAAALHIADCRDARPAPDPGQVRDGGSANTLGAAGSVRTFTL
jgi:hypothetical protein